MALSVSLFGVLLATALGAVLYIFVAPMIGTLVTAIVVIAALASLSFLIFRSPPFIAGEIVGFLMITGLYVLVALLLDGVVH